MDDLHKMDLTQSLHLPCQGIYHHAELTRQRKLKQDMNL